MELGRGERARERLVNEKYRKVRERGKEKGEGGRGKRRVQSGCLEILSPTTGSYHMVAVGSEGQW